MTKSKEEENFQMVFVINDIVPNILLEQELNVFVRSANLRILSIKGSSVTLVTQVFVSPKLQKIEEVVVGVIFNLHTRFCNRQMVQIFLVGHIHSHIKTHR
jgi:hypothetical protein